ncbi:hypothetical protein ACWFOS_17070 [Gordonia terrae]
MGRHAASATLHVSGVMTYLSAGEQRQHFLWWHGPASQWRIARSDGTVVYLRDTTGRSYQRSSGGELQELGGRIAVQAQGADYPEPAFTITDLQTDDHRDAAWFAP